MSSQTIRRDISELDRTGTLERRPGGAKLPHDHSEQHLRCPGEQVGEDFKDKAAHRPDHCGVYPRQQFHFPYPLGTAATVEGHRVRAARAFRAHGHHQQRAAAALTLNKKTDLEVVLASGYMRNGTATALWGKAQSNSSTVFSAIT